MQCSAAQHAESLRRDGGKEQLGFEGLVHRRRLSAYADRQVLSNKVSLLDRARHILTGLEKAFQKLQ